MTLTDVNSLNLGVFRSTHDSNSPAFKKRDLPSTVCQPPRQTVGGFFIIQSVLLGTRTYAVISVEKVSVNDSSGTAATTDNRVTLYTCVMNQPEYRWCVTAVQV